ncbi:MAG: DUF1573 domain-containing protein [Bacteroidales bacterium]|jgi:hypothetical protein|nr:DUF1573 domain-containing protein [Bacteroidales bacterium]
MKKVIYLFLIMCGFSVLSHAQTNTDSLVFDHIVYDYGTISQGSDGACQFTLTNNGDNPIILSNVKASCGCTIPTWPRTPINPGESAVIDVKYDTKRIGRFNKAITVYSNAANSPVVLRIMGSVEVAK